MAMTKLRGLFENPKAFDTPQAQAKETMVCTMKMRGMMANSTRVSAVNWEASLVKTRSVSCMFPTQATNSLTQAWGEERHIEFSGELLHFGCEQALSGDNVARQTDAHNFQDCFEDQHCEARQGRVGGVWWQRLLSMA